MKKILICLMALGATGSCFAQAVMPELALEEFSEGFSVPIGIENCGDERLFIVEQTGMIWIVNAAGIKSASPFIDLSDKIQFDGAERGLLGLAFHPDYATNGYFYVNYTNVAGNTRISRFSVSDDNPMMADASSEMVMIKVKQPYANHNGGCLRFGPDGYLYIGLGDGGDAGDPNQFAQDPGSLLGKLLRIDVNGALPYSIPVSNPFVGVEGYMPEIYALGLRNPWRFSFDRTTGDLWLADVGQDKWEEINYKKADLPGGQNYGWDCKEGFKKFEPANCDVTDQLTHPIYAYSHDMGCTVIGGFVYRGTEFPNMIGKYFFNDYCSGVYSTIVKGETDWVTHPLLTEGAFEYVTFGENYMGELYVSDVIGGEILKIIDNSEIVLRFASENSSANLYPNPNNGEFSINYTSPEDGNYIVSIKNMMGQQIVSSSTAAQKGINMYAFTNTELLPGNYIINLKGDSGTITEIFSVR